jgi:hypothetical protein
MILAYSFATMTLDTTVAFGTTVAFVILLVALLTSLPVIWRKGHFSNFSALQRVQLPNLF